MKVMRCFCLKLATDSCIFEFKYTSRSRVDRVLPIKNFLNNILFIYCNVKLNGELGSEPINVEYRLPRSFFAHLVKI